MPAALRIATCRQLPEPDPDQELLLTALHARGIRARMAAWNDPAEDWAVRVPTVIRSTWDHFHELPRFLAWAEAAGATAPLWNSPGIVRWNAHKGYLLELARRGHAVVPTALVPRGAQGALGTLCAARGWRDVVVKPAVSAASFATARFSDPAVEAAALHFAARVHAGDTLVQPYVPSVEAYAPMVMELELIEPSLFLAQHPPAVDRLVAGLARRLG